MPQDRPAHIKGLPYNECAVAGCDQLTTPEGRMCEVHWSLIPEQEKERDARLLRIMLGIAEETAEERKRHRDAKGINGIKVTPSKERR